MPPAWAVAALAVFSIGVLLCVLTVLSAAGRPPRAGSAEDVLSMLLALHERGTSHSGSVSREDFCKAVADCAAKLTGAESAAVRLDASGTGGRQPSILVPLTVQSKRVGTLELSLPGGAAPLGAAQNRALAILAAEAGVLLHNLDVLDHMQTFYIEIVQTLSRAVETKDPYSKGHSDRARALARELARELAMPEQAARYVEYAAMLHRVGKIGVDQTLLNKPGKLTPKEYEEIKKYTTIGHQMLAPARFLGPVAEIVLYHQEWFNGQGYPEGLKGERIPLGARIVAVINAWEAMTADRPYRRALDPAAAREQLRKGAGTQFDPAVVDAFLRIKPSANGA